jgi:hypothetical protein
MDAPLAIQQLSDGQIHIVLTGVDWQRYTLMSSDDMHTWSTNNPTFTMLGAVRQLTNNPATNGPGVNQRFFRAIRNN